MLPRAPSVTSQAPEPVPQPHQPAWRDYDDGEENEPDDGVETADDNWQRHDPDVVVDDDEGESSEPGTLDAAEAPDDGDDQEIDRRAETDVVGRDHPVPPAVEHARQRRDERGERECERTVERDVVAE